MTNTTILWLSLSILGGLSIGYFQYLFRSSVSSLKIALAALRGSSVALIVLLLFNFNHTISDSYIVKQPLNILVDNSLSIKYLNQDSLVLNMVGRFKNQFDLNERFDVNFYAFGQQFKRYDSVLFDAPITHLSEAIIEINDKTSMVSTTVLLTDGNQNFGSNAIYAADSVVQTVFPMVFGPLDSPFDSSIEAVNHNPYTYSGNKTEIEITVLSNKLTENNSFVYAFLNGKKVAESRVSFRESKSHIFSLILPSSKPGLNNYSIVLDPIDNEQNTGNNAYNIAIETIDESSNVAIITNISHPDVGALTKAINALDATIADVLSPDEFLLQKEKYRAAFLYQPNEQFSKLTSWMKASGFQVAWVIGIKSNLNWLNQAQNNFSFELTEETETYDLFYNTNFDLFTIEASDFESWPPIEANFGRLQFKVSNTPLFFKEYQEIAVEDDPLWSLYETGSVKGAVLRGENIWRWRAQSFVNSGSFESFDVLVHQIVRFLTNNVNRNQLQLAYKSIYNESDQKEVSALWLNENLENNSTSELLIRINNLDNSLMEERQMIYKSGRYRASIEDIKEGSYSFEIIVNGSRQSGGSFKIENRNIETHKLSANFEDMYLLASQTGGTLYTPEQFDELVSQLLGSDSFRPVEKFSQKIVPLHTIWWLLAILILTISSEWFLRKYNGLL